MDNTQNPCLWPATPYQRPTNALLTSLPLAKNPNVNYIVHDIFFRTRHSTPTDRKHASHTDTQRRETTRPYHDKSQDTIKGSAN